MQPGTLVTMSAAFSTDFVLFCADVSSPLLQKVGKHAYSEPLMLGLMAHLCRAFPRVGFFKPIVGMDYQPLGTQHYPRLPVVMHRTFKMKADPGKMFAMSEDAAFRVCGLGTLTVLSSDVLPLC